MSDLLNEIKNLSKDLFYLSEGMHPMKSEKIKLKNKQSSTDFICKKYNCTTNQINKLHTDFFFQKVSNSTDSLDVLLNKNAENFSKLYTFIQEHFSEISVYRIEKGTQIPIAIFLSNNKEYLFLLETLAEETG